jgi:hypothetical protein
MKSARQIQPIKTHLYQQNIAGIFPEHYIFERFIIGVDLSSGLFDLIRSEQK